LILYTDGVVDAQNPQEAFFGKERLLACAHSNLGRSAQQIQYSIIEDINEFSAGAPQADDITLVVIVRTHDTAE